MSAPMPTETTKTKTNIAVPPVKALAKRSAGTIAMQLAPKAAIMRKLNDSLQTNDYGLPDYIYRADLIPNELDPNSPASIAEHQEHLEMAVIELDYTQGFPTQPDGEPFWARLPNESAEAHRAFVSYLDLPRKKNSLNGQVDAATAVRQVHALKDEMGLPASTLLEMAYLYYWQQRSLAYDLFITASHNKRREYALQDVENEHLRIAAKYTAEAENFLDQVFADPDKYELSPREAMDLLVKMIQVSRLSLGASPFGQKSGKAEHELPQNAPLEVILRTLVQQSGATNTNRLATAEDLTKKLFQNPDDLAAAQELIIRMGATRDGRNTAPATIDHDSADTNQQGT